MIHKVTFYLQFVYFPEIRNVESIAENMINHEKHKNLFTNNKKGEKHYVFLL